MEDSISCSPTLDNNGSFHMQRQRRKSKRKVMEKEKKQQSNDHNYVQSPHPVEGFDQIDEELDNPRDQTFQVHSPSSMTRRKELQLHYEMFEDVFSLADQVDCEQAARAHKQRKGLKSTQGFQTASQKLTAALSDESYESDLLGIETEFGLTKTQLFNYCDRFDQNDPSKSGKTKVDTNRMSLSIVDIILHDFCSSPEYRADEVMINDEVTAAPYFRFRGQIIKTYSRDKTYNDPLKQQDQEAQRMEDDDDDRISSCSSDLSVQEDLTNSTQLPTVVIGNIDLNSSQRLCQNLLNISAFFTANTEEGSIAPNNIIDSGNLKSAEITFESCSEFTLKPSIEPQIVAEEFNFDKNYSDEFNDDISWSFDDYHWFSSQHSIQSPVKFKEPDFELEDKHSLSDINSKYDSEQNCDTKPITEKLNTFDSSEKRSISKSKNCDDHLIMEHSKGDNSKKEANVSLKSDDWFNDDFDYDFNTEDILIKTKEDFVVSEKHDTTKIDTRKTECLEETILLKKKIASLQIEYLEEKPCTSRQAMQRINAVHTSKEIDDHENKLKDFASDSKNNEHQGDEELNYELSQWLLDDVVEHKFDNLFESTTKTVGFCTARNKSIHVSETAKQKVASIVAELPDLPVKTNNDERKSYPIISKDKLEDTSIKVGFDKLLADQHNCDNIELSQWILDDVTKRISNSQKKSPTVVSFCTAGNKSIQVSDAAKRKAASIVAELPELPITSNDEKRKSDPTSSKDMIESLAMETGDSKINELQLDEENVCDNIELSQWLLDDVTKHKYDNELEKPPTVVGFCTAGNKSIQVSDAAKRKAASIVAELPQLPIKSNNEERKSNPTSSKDMIESLAMETGDSKINKLKIDEENVCDNIELSQWLLDDVTKHKYDNELEKPPTVVGFCTAGNKSIQVSNAAKRKAASIVAELPELPIQRNNEKRKSDPTSSKDMIESLAMETGDSKINELQVDEENVCDNIEQSQWLLDDVTKHKYDNELEKPPTVVGFCTAGNKTIQVLDAAKRKAASIVAELPELPIQRNNEERKSDATNRKDMIESLAKKTGDSKISELQVDEDNVCDNIELSQWLLDDVAKHKYDNELEKPPTVVGFCTAGNKSIQVSDAAKRKAASIVAELPELPIKSNNEERKSDPTSSKDMIESLSKEVVDSKINELQVYEENVCDNIELSQWLLDDVVKHKYDNELEKPPTVVGFCTARNKNINVSDAAKRKAASIVSELPELPVKGKIEITAKEVVGSKINERQLDEKNVSADIELSEWLLDDVAKQKCDNELEPPTVVDLGTAGNKSIKAYDATKRNSASIVSESPDLLIKNSKEELKKEEITNKRKFDETIVEAFVKKIKKNNDLEDELDSNKLEMRKWSLDETTNLNSGTNLKTLNNIEIRKWSLDEAAYRNSGNMLKPPNFPTTSNNEKSKIDARINLIKWEVRSVDFSSQKNNDVKEKQESLQRRLSLLNDITKEKTDASIKSTTFKTLNISSEAASQKASSIVSQLSSFPEKNIKEFKSNKTTNKRKLEETNIEMSVEKIMKINNAEDEESLVCDKIERKKCLLNSVTDHITDTEFCSTPIAGYCSLGNKSTYDTKVTELPEISMETNKQKSNEKEEECESVSNVKKMKLNDSFTETPVKSSVLILSKSQTLDNFRTPQSRFQLSQTQSSLTELLARRSPLEKYTKSSIISRKNLLTLNKKRKLRHSQNDDEYNLDTMENMMIENEDLEETHTPVRQKSLHQMANNLTPHSSNVYMNSLSTSTPQPLKSINGQISYDLENDLQHIIWPPEEGELSKSLSNSATKPSPKERIERLRIYGDPPALSPIATTTISSLSANSRSFRAPGLRRRRILSKPK